MSEKSLCTALLPSSMSRRSRSFPKKKCPKQSSPRTRRVPLSRRPWQIFVWVETWQDTFLSRITSHSRRPPRSRAWRATTRPPCMSSDTGVDMRPASSGNSRPALARNLTPPRNLSPSLRLHFCAPNSACRVNCGIAATSTIGSSYSKVIRARSSPPRAKHPRRQTICAHSRRRGMKYLVLDNKRYLWKDILKLRREQRNAARNAQPALFELQDDQRPKSQSTASSRYEEPTLFE